MAALNDKVSITTLDAIDRKLDTRRERAALAVFQSLVSTLSQEDEVWTLSRMLKEGPQLNADGGMISFEDYATSLADVAIGLADVFLQRLKATVVPVPGGEAAQAARAAGVDMTGLSEAEAAALQTVLPGVRLPG